MILIGRFLSPFVRRVAATLIYQELDFEHRAIRAAGDDQDIIRKSNPLGRVPVLILDNEEVLSDSAVILDYIDQQVGDAKALMPQSGWERLQAMNLLGIATGASEKSIGAYSEYNRPEDKQHAPAAENAARQATDGFEYLNGQVSGDWMLGDKISQLDISITAYMEFFRISSPDVAKQMNCPGLDGIVAKALDLPCFKQTDPEA